MKIKLHKTIYFIGFMGAGKTTVCRKLAKVCGCECVDVDFYIERFRGKKISEIFDEVGESGFREYETEALLNISKSNTPRLVSCGGGIIVTDENIKIMNSSGIVIHLYSDAENGARRISNKKTRPLFKDVKKAQKLFFQRLPKYEEAADYTIDTTRKTSGRVYHEVIDMMSEEGLIDIIES